LVIASDLVHCPVPVQVLVKMLVAEAASRALASDLVDYLVPVQVLAKVTDIASFHWRTALNSAFRGRVLALVAVVLAALACGDSEDYGRYQQGRLEQKRWPGPSNLLQLHKRAAFQCKQVEF